MSVVIRALGYPGCMESSPNVDIPDDTSPLRGPPGALRPPSGCGGSWPSLAVAAGGGPELKLCGCVARFASPSSRGV
eukprot:CAMPEP_0179099960 /NCGR_PEP_ID=MMETSP0796-20121207/46137_1 /TAXON_ID=73915 /ORGANISM="Pyrodinium bahamense, Strain pbaha01" /LENGTH=76 /DNA_ID=CAMNT_0020797763 /DNA_START=665 /DNA_END=895 /DNA_ORIENTATION=+